MKNNLFSKKSNFRLINFNTSIILFFSSNHFLFFKNHFINNFNKVLFKGFISECLLTLTQNFRIFHIDNSINFIYNSYFLNLNCIQNIFSYFNWSRKFYTNTFKSIHFGYGSILRLKGVGYKAYLKNRFVYFRLGRSHWCFSFIPFFFFLKFKKTFRIFFWSFIKFNIGNYLYRIKNFRKPGTYTGKGVHIRGKKFTPKKTNLKVWI